MLKLYYRKIERNSLPAGERLFILKKSTIQKTPATFFVGLLIFILKTAVRFRPSA
nr:MAG TPA: hypothetical protein [Caudoviricetes sp.]